MRILLGLIGMACIVWGIVFCFLEEIRVVGAAAGVPLLIIGIIIVLLARRDEGL